MVKIIIIGGGASGMAAAVSARRTNADAEITILERMDRVGKKILATGNGCCNFSNAGAEFNNFHGKNPEFVLSALNEFTVEYTVSFFNKLGVLAKEKEKGKLYPYSEQASAVLDALRKKVISSNVNIVTGFDVKTVLKTKKGFKVVAKDGREVLCDRLIVAAGGCASPALGSDGSGFKILKDLGHSVTKLEPALVQLKTKTDEIKGLKGIKVTGDVTAYQNDKEIGFESGEVLFTDYGVSGPPVFQLSALTAFKNNVSLKINFMPNYLPKEVFDILEERKNNLSDMTMEDYFSGLLNKRVGNVISRRIGIEKLSYPVSSLNKNQLWAIAKEIQGFKLTVTGTNGFNNAQVTAGGALTSEFDAETLESKLVKKLYCCGEVLDVYGDCGGYNLQWAWSSGFLAGRNAAE